MTNSEMKLDLPHITTRAKAGGGVRYYFRRRGAPTVRLPDNPLTPEFMDAYNAELNRKAMPRAGYDGSFEWLCDQYRDSPEFKNRALATRKARARIIESMLNEPIDITKETTFGQERATKIGSKHCLSLRNRKSEAPHAANERLKILSQIFKLAVARGWRDDIPSRDVPKISIKTDGHETATDAHIEAFFNYHTEGTPRLAMRILTAFGMRVSDLRILGPQHIKNGLLTFYTVKTGVLCELPIPSDLMTEMKSASDMVFLKSAHGKPFESDKAMSQRVSKWISQSGGPYVFLFKPHFA